LNRLGFFEEEEEEEEEEVRFAIRISIAGLEEVIPTPSMMRPGTIMQSASANPCRVLMNLYS
jgi:hypothetical protein